MLILAAVLFLTAPLVVTRYYYVELEHGSFPIEADSIGIPIFSFVILTVVTAPLTWGVIWLCARRYPGAVSLVVWNVERPLWSALWTCAFVGSALVFLFLAPWSDAVRHPFLVTHICVDLYVLLVLRSGLVAQDGGVASPAY
jgi:hypothetical protein